MHRPDPELSPIELPAVSGRKRKAFTLVELLVVIGIIALIVGILLPTLSAARRQAALVTCSSNQRQIAMAALLHAHSHRGYLPLAGELIGAQTATFGGDAFATALNDPFRRRYTYANCTSINSTYIPVPLPGALAAEMGYKGLPFDDWDKFDQALNEIGFWRRFMCPATESFAKPRYSNNPKDTTPIGQGMMLIVAPDKSGALASWSSNSDFAFNEGVFGYHWDVRYSGRRLNGKLVAMHRADTIVLFSDAIPRSTPPYSWTRDGWICWTPSLTATGRTSLADALANNGKAADVSMFDTRRHRKRINIAFGDGHVQTMQITAADLQSALLLPE